LKRRRLLLRKQAVSSDEARAWRASTSHLANIPALSRSAHAALALQPSMRVVSTIMVHDEDTQVTAVVQSVFACNAFLVHHTQQFSIRTRYSDIYDLHKRHDMQSRQPAASTDDAFATARLPPKGRRPRRPPQLRRIRTVRTWCCTRNGR
jgi:hypothetical protein